MAARPLLALEDYYRLLAPLTTSLDIWETEQLQVVDGKSPVYDWIKVSALRPVMQALTSQEQARFIYHFLMRVHAYYPPEKRADAVSVQADFHCRQRLTINRSQPAAAPTLECTPL